MSINKITLGERTFKYVNALFLTMLMVITLYPLLYVLFASISVPSEFIRYRGILWRPLGFSTVGYKLVLKNPSLWSGYFNTIFYVVVGTSLNILMTSVFAYVLSRKRFLMKKFFMFTVIFTMFFNGGLIPTYLVVKSLGLIDNRFAVILPTLISTINLIIMRTSFQAIPDSMEESAKIDGASHFTILFRIILPLSKSLLAVMVLFYGVYHWNSWFNALIYFSQRSLFPLQLILREILITNTTQSMLSEYSGAQDIGVENIIKYSTIIIATAPILVLYPFMQRYFVKGVMIGAIKG